MAKTGGEPCNGRGKCVVSAEGEGQCDCFTSMGYTGPACGDCMHDWVHPSSSDTRCIRVSGPSCFDGIQNQDEEGVDCGGLKCKKTCPPEPTNTDTGLGTVWVVLFVTLAVTVVVVCCVKLLPMWHRRRLLKPVKPPTAKMARAKTHEVYMQDTVDKLPPNEQPTTLVQPVPPAGPAGAGAGAGAGDEQPAPYMYEGQPGLPPQEPLPVPMPISGLSPVMRNALPPPELDDPAYQGRPSAGDAARAEMYATDQSTPQRGATAPYIGASPSLGHLQGTPSAAGRLPPLQSSTLSVEPIDESDMVDVNASAGAGGGAGGGGAGLDGAARTPLSDAGYQDADDADQAARPRVDVGDELDDGPASASGRATPPGAIMTPNRQGSQDSRLGGGGAEDSTRDVQLEDFDSDASIDLDADPSDLTGGVEENVRIRY